MANGNVGHIRPVLRDVKRRFVRDRVEFTFVNLTVSSRNRSFVVELPALKRALPRLPLPADPRGAYQVFITPERYRSKSLFARVRPNRTVDLESEFFIDPEKALPRFPFFSTLEGKQEWSDLRAVLGFSGFGESEYEGLSRLQKGALFNVHAKMREQKLADGRSVFSFIRRLVRVEEERVFWRADPELLPRTRHHVEGFRFVSGALHQGFSEGFQRDSSFKTHEKVGSLQLTYATNSAGELEVDADLDDHSGIRHAFDVLRHRITGDKTHPFDIHQVLVKFHGIDPGYHLT